MKNKSILLILILVLSIDNSYSQLNIWKQKASIPGISRWGAYSFAIGNFGYIGGGYNLSNLYDFWQYDPNSDTWTQKSNCPMATRTAGCFSINGYGYVVGGIKPPGNTITDSLYQYNPLTNVWLPKAKYPGVPIYGGASFALGGKGYYGIGNSGGANGPYINSFYQYDPLTDQWSQKATFPGQNRYGVHGSATNNYGYVGFGLNQALNVFFNDWYQYNPISNSWVQKQNFPSSRSYPTSFFINNKIYLGTGHFSANTTYDDLFSYDETNDIWIAEPNYIAGGRWCGIGFAINNKGYFGTGLDFTNSNSYADFYEFSPDSVVCITLKPGGDLGKDALILSGLPNYNSEPHHEFMACAWTCQGSPCIDRGLIQFDLSFIPPNASLISAELNLYANTNPTTIPVANYGINNAFLIQRITSPWNEFSVTWNNQPTTTIQNELLVPQSTSSNQNCLNLNVTNLVSDMLNDPLNSFGFMIKLANEVHYNGRDFASSDNLDSSTWPEIAVCYSIPVAISHYEEQNNYFNVYPTMFNDKLNIEFISKSNIVKIDILDATGRIIVNRTLLSKTNNRNFVVFDSDDLGNFNGYGICFIRFIDNNTIVTKRLVRIKL